MAAQIHALIAPGRRQHGSNRGADNPPTMRLASTIESSIPYTNPAGYPRTPPAASRTRCVKIALLMSALLWASPADDAAPCPTREAVAQALSLTQAVPGGLPEDVRITDLGDGFDVAVGRQLQHYADPARDCVERARVAAVFVALVLYPPAPPPRPAPPVVVAPPPPPPPPPPRPASWVDAGLAARFDAAAGGGHSAMTGGAMGAEVRLAVGRHLLGGEATAGLLTASDSPLSDVRVRQQRFPCSLAATARLLTGSHVELAGAAGLSLTPFTLRGQGLATQLASTRLDTGVRVAFAARWTRHALAPFAEVHLEWFPRTYAVWVMPLGDVGNTAPLQVGLSVGVDLAVRSRREP